MLQKILQKYEKKANEAVLVKQDVPLSICNNGGSFWGGLGIIKPCLRNKTNNQDAK